MSFNIFHKGFIGGVALAMAGSLSANLINDYLETSKIKKDLVNETHISPADLKKIEQKVAKTPMGHRIAECQRLADSVKTKGLVDKAYIEALNACKKAKP